MKFKAEDLKLGLFDVAGRDTLVKTAKNISELRAKIHLAEYISLYEEVKKEHSEYFYELVNKRDVIKLCLEHNLDDKLIKIKREWFSDTDSSSCSAGVRKWIEFISDRNKLVLGYLSDIENSWYRSDSVDFDDYAFEYLKDYCMYFSLRAIPRNYLKVIYESPKYKSTIKFRIDVESLHSIWNQINLSLANYSAN